MNFPLMNIRIYFVFFLLHLHLNPLGSVIFVLNFHITRLPTLSSHIYHRRPYTILNGIQLPPFRSSSSSSPFPFYVYCHYYCLCFQSLYSYNMSRSTFSNFVHYRSHAYGIHLCTRFLSYLLYGDSST